MTAFRSRTLTSLFKVHRFPPLCFTSLIPSRNNIQTPTTTCFTKTLCTSPAHHGIGSSSDEEEIVINKPKVEYRRNQTNIALGITKKLLLNEAKDSNLVCAPLSIQVVLSLLNSKTNSTFDDRALASELAARVFADGSQKGGPRVSCANGLWVDESVHLEPSLEQAVGSAYNSALHRVDFKTEYEEVRTRVNSWVEEETNGLIKGVLSPGSVNSLTRLLFANALYFKGDWADKFAASLTKKYDFHLLNGNPVKAVPFMTSCRERQYISEFDGFKVLKLLYRTGKDKRLYSMCLFLPDAKDGLPAMVERLNSECGLRSHIPYSKQRVGEFRIPKFKFSFDFAAARVLKELGLLGGLTEEVKSRVGEPLYIPSIYQKAVIEVNEEGTEAAAVTFGVEMSAASPCPPKPKVIDFVADHPFMFVIREEVTETVLFIGYVLNPLLKG
ncbi:putative Serpin family protein [Rosa chinensis]|uniref:Putative Serpin family protein n=2 Tax=Rosa chinensis TaxID=74649 RepID=A0A2P6P9K1_ROSCH|nr:putative Serpin family protein [Rosa chinensis]